MGTKVGLRRRNQGRRTPLRHRGLRIEQFEERMLLSVAPQPPTRCLSTRAAHSNTSAPTGQAVAGDNNGDFVVTWQQYDNNGAGGTDSNIYARYYTNAVQRIDLPAGLSAGTTIGLQYNGNAVEKISISAETKPFTNVYDSSNNVAGIV